MISSLIQSGITHLLENTGSSILKATLDTEKEMEFEHSISFPVDAFVVIESSETKKKAVLALIELQNGGKQVDEHMFVKSTVVSGDGLECHVRLLEPEDKAFANRFLGPYDLSKPVDLEIIKQLIEKH